MRLAVACAVLVLGVGVARAEDGLATFGEAGIQLDGVVLFQGKVQAADHDADQELIWFRSGATLQVIDLRAKKPKAVVILKKLPPGPIAVTGWSSAWVTDPTLPEDRRFLEYTELQLGKAPKVLAVFEERTLAGNTDQRDPNKKVKVAGKAWLKKQRKRKPKERIHEKQWSGKVTFPPSWPCPEAPTCTSCGDESEVEEYEAWWKANCRDSLIGTATVLVSNLQRVVVYEHELDGPFCVIHDEARDRFAPVGGGAWADVADVGSCDLAASGAAGAYLHAGAVCRGDDAGISCALPAGGVGFAWIRR